jgi:hypothetical protein
MRLSIILRYLAMAAAVLLAFWAFTYLRLISQEDYSPRRGSLAYYVGISSLVRNAPTTDALGEPDYFGSVGDGNKPPQSELSYATAADRLEPAGQALQAYLLGRGFQPRTAPARPADSALAQGEQLIRQSEYASASGEIATLVLAADASAHAFRITLTHYD